jgi:hypothetical protein
VPSSARIASCLAALAGAVALGGCGGALPPAPAQPIKFSHRIHAGVNRIGCQVCHSYVERGPVAGVPSMARCQGCHKFVKEDKQDQAITAEIKAQLQHLDDEKPIEWVRVHRLPDHVFFTHQRHVRAGVECRECHGAVEQMEAVRQVSPLTMGWCLSCHQRKQAERPVERARLTECLTCHK